MLLTKNICCQAVYMLPRCVSAAERSAQGQYMLPSGISPPERSGKGGYMLPSVVYAAKWSAEWYICCQTECDGNDQNKS